MKALKIWGFALLAAAVVLFLIGFIGGEFNEAGGFYGSSPEAMVLSLVSGFCLLLSVTVFLVHGAIKK